MEVGIAHRLHTGNLYKRSSLVVTNKTSSMLAQGPQPTEPTISQLTLFILWIFALCVWTFRFLNARNASYRTVEQKDVESGEVSEKETETGKGQHSTTHTINRKDGSKASPSDIENENCAENELHKTPNGDAFNTKVVTKNDKQDQNKSRKDASRPKDSNKDAQFSKLQPPPTLDQFLKYCALLGLIMMYYYVCDYYHRWPRADREYSRDTFAFLCIALVAVAAIFTIKTTPDKLINR